MTPSLVVHLYLIGLPPGETAFAVSCTCGAPLLSQARTMFASEFKLSERGALAAETTCGFCAKTWTADKKTTRAIGATYPISRFSGGNLYLNICTPYLAVDRRNS